MSELPARKIFISYSWTSEEHQTAVRDIATRLMTDGVDVVLDVWELREGHDLNFYMEKMVVDPSVHKVLIICDAGYVKKANARTGGVGTETQLISPEVYQKVDQNKFIPVVFALDEEGKPWLPAFLKSRLFVDLSTVEKRETNYDRLLRAIFDQPEHQKPKLGTPPTHLLSGAPSPSAEKHQLDRVKAALMEGKAQAPALVRAYLRRKVAELDGYRINIGPSAVAYDELIVDSIGSMLPYRDEFVDFVSVLLEYGNAPDSYEAVADFLQSALAYHFAPKGMNSWMAASFDNFKFLTYELFLYFVAAAIKARRFEELNGFLRREFFVANPTEEDRFWNFLDLRPWLQSLDVDRRQRLGSRRVSHMAELLKERAAHKDIDFDNLAEADIALYFRSRLGEVKRGTWYPYTVLYRGLGSGPSKLFLMAESKKHFANLKLILGAGLDESGPALLERYLRGGGQTELSFSAGSLPISIRGFISFEKLGTRP
jgi:hypothetical protein